MKKITNIVLLLSLLILWAKDSTQQQSVSQPIGVVQQTIYQFLSSNSNTNKFMSLLTQVATQTNDQTIISLLSGPNSNSPQNMQNSVTVFCPVNGAFSSVPTDTYMLRNSLYNLIVKGALSLAQLSSMNGQNISQTYGYMPRLSIQVVSNFYSRQPNIFTTTNNRRKRQMSPINSTVNQNSIYDQYSTLYGTPATQFNVGANISPKMSQDQLILLNNAIIMDKIDLTNGVVYMISAFPRYYEKSIYMLLKDNSITGLSQNLNFWANQADQAFKAGDENLKNALNSFGPATYFLSTDQAINAFNDRSSINNSTFVFDVLLRSQRISNQIIFDYYLDNLSNNYVTDTGLPVSTVHTQINGQETIQISIGHVKGYILPDLRNIYCTSGVIHLIDTVLVAPLRNAYQQIALYPQLSVFKTLLDRSTKYQQMLQAAPAQVLYPTQSTQGNQILPSKGKRQLGNSFSNSLNNFNNKARYGIPYAPNFNYLTVFAPNDDSLLAFKDEALKSDANIEAVLSAHIIQSQSSVYYTNQDQSLFVNNQAYNTLNPNYVLNAIVQKDPTKTFNYVSFRVPSKSPFDLVSNIISGDDRVSNGVLHIIDRPFTVLASSDISSLLTKYSTANTAGNPAFNQFLGVLQSTGIFNDLSSKNYTLFIPTNQALANYQNILSNGDINTQKNLVYRHLCIGNNLQSISMTNTINSNVNGSSLICRNALGQDLTLTKDTYGLISTWQGHASSKVINDFPGVSASAYLIEQPLFNQNLPNLGLNMINSAKKHFYSKFLLFGLLFTCWSKVF